MAITVTILDSDGIEVAPVEVIMLVVVLVVVVLEKLKVEAEQWP